MLILCMGPDTFLARRKVQELERAFVEKYDAGRTAVEELPTGKDAIEALANRTGAMGLFSSRRFLRATNLVTDCPKTKQKVLAQTLMRDPEGTIVVSLEEELVTDASLKFLEGAKIIKYSFPERHGRVFQAWIEQEATALGLSDVAAIQKIAIATEGDSWLAWNELSKLAAGGTSELTSLEADKSIFDQADAYLRGDSQLRQTLLRSASFSEIAPAFLNQARAYLRVRDQATDGLHPFVIKKMQTQRITDGEERFARLLAALFCQRSGVATETEVLLFL